ncbi:MAG: hypothetical protein KGJ13_02375 [Patescibacteria group bacterium]|nr:hypothetical protein [Patescibacteria group bacterium]
MGRRKLADAGAAAEDSTSQDPLLAELMGDGKVHPKVLKQDIKRLDAPEPDRPDPLDTANQERLAKTLPDYHTKKADEQFSTAVGGKGYKVTLKGEYFAVSKDNERTKVRKPYEVSVNIAKLDKALGIIVGNLLGPALKRKYPDYSTFRTYQIVGAVPLSAETPQTSHLQYMTKAQLVAHIRDIQAPIDPQDYPDVAELREAVIDYSYNPKDFVKREAKRMETRDRQRELRSLNPDLEVGTQ